MNKATAPDCKCRIFGKLTRDLALDRMRAGTNHRRRGRWATPLDGSGTVGTQVRHL